MCKIKYRITDTKPEGAIRFPKLEKVGWRNKNKALLFSLNSFNYTKISLTPLFKIKF